MLRRWKKKRLVKRPISRSRARATKALSAPMPTAMAEMGRTRQVVREIAELLGARRRGLGVAHKYIVARYIVQEVHWSPCAPAGR